MKKFLRHFRPHPHSKGRSAGKVSRHDFHDGQLSDHYAPPIPGHDFTQRLPPLVLSKIFAEVCPHALDDSYNSSEESMTEDGCMLCDMRDLAHCALVCRRWHHEAQALLYVESIHELT